MSPRRRLRRRQHLRQDLHPRGEAPCAKIFEDDELIAFLDLFPQSRSHALVISRAAKARNLLDIDPGRALPADHPRRRTVAAGLVEGRSPDGLGGDPLQRRAGRPDRLPPAFPPGALTTRKRLPWPGHVAARALADLAELSTLPKTIAPAYRIASPRKEALTTEVRLGDPDSVHCSRRSLVGARGRARRLQIPQGLWMPRQTVESPGRTMSSTASRPTAFARSLPPSRARRSSLPAHGLASGQGERLEAAECPACMRTGSSTSPTSSCSTLRLRSMAVWRRSAR